MARTPKGRRLGDALREARESQQPSITLRELGSRIDRNSGTLSRYETNERTPKPEDVAQILTALGIKGAKYDEVMSLARDTDAPLWVATTLPEQKQQLAAVVDSEQNSRYIIEVSPLLVPGLLQAREYITAIMSGGGISAGEIVTRTAIRVARRDVILRENPAEFTAFVGETALYQMIGGPKVLAAQLRHLAEMCLRPNIHVHIITFDSDWQPAMEGPFVIIDDTVVHIENRKSGLFLHETDDVQTYLEAVDMVRRAAKSEEQSAEIISRRLNEMERLQ